MLAGSPHSLCNSQNFNSEPLNPLHYCHTGNALDFILRFSFNPTRGMRADSQKIAVLITAGNSTDDVSVPSQHLRDTGIEVYVIGIVAVLLCSKLLGHLIRKVSQYL